MRQKSFYILLIIIASATGCELEVRNIDLPEFSQKIVVNSFISPYDSISFVSISPNEKIYGELDEPVSLGKITATVSSGQKTVTLKEINGRFIFRRTDMAVEEGKTYLLRINTENGLYSEASCTVPVGRELNAETDTVHELNTDAWMPGIKNIRTRIYITDPAGEANYYRSFWKELDYYGEVSSVYAVWTREPEILSDAGKDGQRLYVNSASTIEPSENMDSSFLIIYLLQTDKEYFDYHKSMENYSGGSNPFQEIYPVFSNVKGGLGIFASYVADSVVVRLK